MYIHIYTLYLFICKHELACLMRAKHKRLTRKTSKPNLICLACGVQTCAFLGVRGKVRSRLSHDSWSATFVSAAALLAQRQKLAQDAKFSDVFRLSTLGRVQTCITLCRVACPCKTGGACSHAPGHDLARQRSRPRHDLPVLLRSLVYDLPLLASQWRW